MEKEKKENSRITLGIPALVTEGSKLMDKNGMVEITILMEWSKRISLMYEQRPKGNKGGSLEDFWEKSSWSVGMPEDWQGGQGGINTVGKGKNNRRSEEE